jgi:uncharacterized protein
MEEARGDAGLSERRLALQNRFYDAIRHRTAGRIAERKAVAGGFERLRGHKYCLLVTFKRTGEAVPTPVWFGLDDAGRLYVRTGRDVAKVRRIRNDPRVLVAPCTLRGKPLGDPVEGTARVVEPDEEGHAEDSLARNYGLGRRLYEGMGDAVADAAYLEVAPGTPA